MCGHSGVADPRAPHPILGFAIDREASPSSRLETGVGHGGCTIKGLAGVASIARWSPSSGEDGPSAIPTYFMSVLQMLEGCDDA